MNLKNIVLGKRHQMKEIHFGFSGNPPKKLIELISDYYKITGYRFNTQKSISFLYNCTEQVEVEVKTQYHLH